MVYTTLMKQLLVKIDDELHAQLEQFPNKSETVRLAIISYLEAGPSDGHKTCMTKEEVLDLIKTYIPMGPSTPNNSTTLVPNSIPGLTTGAAFVPKPPDPETGYPCCSGRTPCKHWVWDDMGTEWKNSLTGKTREVI